MARPISYFFCKYSILIEGALLSEAAEFNLVSENQGTEIVYGREKNGVPPQALCTEPVKFEVDGVRAHSFEAGFKPGIRIRQEYKSDSRKKHRKIERDTHTKFGHIVTIPSLHAIAIRDRTSDDMIGGFKTISVLKSLVSGISDGSGEIFLMHATENDVKKALTTWNVSEYSYTARPLNPTGGNLAKLRSQMYKGEQIYKETGKIWAAPGQSLKMADGTLGQTHDLYRDGYAQIGFKGQTAEGHAVSFPKQQFSQDKKKNLSVRENRPTYLRVMFEREAAEDDKTVDVARALKQFYEA